MAYSADLLKVYKELIKRIESIDIRQGGPKGDKGPIGSKGDRGPKGETGPKGDKGDRGLDGAKGEKGPQGPIGPKGSQGATGARGEQGATGPMGRGERGPEGKQGPQGPAGADGASIVSAEIDLDGHLTLMLSNGVFLDCGLLPVGENITKIIRSGGGGGGGSGVALPGPTFLQQPSNATIAIGGTAIFVTNVSSGNGSTITYQWEGFNGVSWSNMVDGVDVSGATTNTLTLTNVPELLTGSRYRLIATNTANSLTSNEATLTVITAETFYMLTESGFRMLLQDNTSFILTQGAP